MTQRRQYKNPPIHEAICEFRFSPKGDWEPTLPDKLRLELSEEYAGESRESRVVEVDIDLHDDSRPNLRLNEGPARTQLVTRDATRMVGVGPDVLSVHMLRPYQHPGSGNLVGWEEFRHRIEDALDAYSAVAGPLDVEQVGLRYINTFVIPQEHPLVEKYLRFVPSTLTGIPVDAVGFVSRGEYTYKDGIHLVLSQGLISADPPELVLLVDLDLVWQAETPVEMGDALTITHDLRDRERVAFEAVITDAARELFDGN